MCFYNARYTVGLSAHCHKQTEVLTESEKPFMANTLILMGLKYLSAILKEIPVMISNWTLSRLRHIRQVAGNCTLNGGTEIDLKALVPFNDSY